MRGKLSPSRADLLRLLITYEPSVLNNILILNGKSLETPNKVSIQEDGQVILYYGKGPKWYQRFFNSHKTVSIIDMAVNIADAMSGSGEARNKTVFQGLTQSVLEEATNNGDLDCVVDILIDSVRNSMNGVLGSKYINKKNIDRYMKERKVTHREAVEVEDPRLDAYLGIMTEGGRVLPVVFGKTTVIRR